MNFHIQTSNINSLGLYRPMVNSGMINAITRKKIYGILPVESTRDHQGLITQIQTQANRKDAPTHFELWLFSGNE